MKETASVLFEVSLTRLELQKALILEAASAKVHAARMSSAWAEDPISKPRRDRPRST